MCQNTRPRSHPYLRTDWFSDLLANDGSPDIPFRFPSGVHAVIAIVWLERLRTDNAFAGDVPPRSTNRCAHVRQLP